MKKFARGLLFCFLVTVSLLLIFMDIPSWSSLDMEKITAYKQTTVLYDAYGAEAAALSSMENRRALEYEEIPEAVINAFLAAEDQRFFTHNGVDIYRVFGALWQDIKTMSLKQGASTITQQLIKLTHLNPGKTIARKANEAYLAMRLENRMSKRDILTHYLNTVYFGGGAYGVEAGARYYFGKGADALTIAETALLAGVIKAPGVYAPTANLEKSVARRNAILYDMYENGALTQAQYEQAAREDVTISENARAGYGFGWYTDAVISEATEVLSITADQLMTGGYRVYTCLDQEMQAQAEALFQENARFPANAADGTRAQAALCCVDTQTGGALALVGGREYASRRALNRATQIRRQPGSALKPVCVYAAAVDRYGMNPTSLLDDTQRVFEGGYAPVNASGKYYGIVTLRQALSRSLNVASVDLMRFTGIGTAREYAMRAGIPIDKDDIGLSLALGSLTYGVSPAGLASAYAPLSNGGTRVDFHTVTRIENARGEVVYAFIPPKSVVMSEDSAYILTNMLETAANTGSAHALSVCGFPVAGKTGTVSESGGTNRDIWTVAYTGKACVCVWMGFDEPGDMRALPAGTVGGGYPARLAAAFLSANESKIRADFSVPDGIERVNIDLSALEGRHRVLLASEYTPKAMVSKEIFHAGDAPTEYSAEYQKPASVTDLSVAQNKDGLPEIRFTAPEDGNTYLVIRTQNGASQIAAQIDAEKFEEVVYADESFEGDACGYSVIPRHRALYLTGRTLTGDESDTVFYQRKTGLLSGVRRLFGGP